MFDWSYDSSSIWAACFSLIGDEFHHLRVAGARKARFVLKRVESAVYQQHSTVMAEKHIIIVGAEKMSLTKNTCLDSSRQLTLMLKYLVDGAYLLITGLPFQAPARSDQHLGAGEHLAVTGLIPVAAPHGNLVAEPRFKLLAEIFERSRHENTEAVIHVSVPSGGIFIKQLLVAPYFRFAQFVVRRISEYVVTRCERHGGDKACANIFQYVHKQRFY